MRRCFTIPENEHNIYCSFPCQRFSTLECSLPPLSNLPLLSKFRRVPKEERISCPRFLRLALSWAPLCPRILPRGVRVLQARARRSPAQCAQCVSAHTGATIPGPGPRGSRGPYTRYTLSRATHDSVTGDRAGAPTAIVTCDKAASLRLFHTYHPVLLRQASRGRFGSDPLTLCLRRISFGACDRKGVIC